VTLTAPIRLKRPRGFRGATRLERAGTSLPGSANGGPLASEAVISQPQQTQEVAVP